MKNEIWKPISSCQKYEVSNLGRVRSWKVINGRTKNCSTTPRLMKLVLGTNGYLNVGLFVDSKPKSFMVHRLVAEAFLPRNISGLQVNHKDSNPVNNKAINLEWVTPQQNILHAKNKGRLKIPLGSQNGRSKLSEDSVLKIRSLYDIGVEPSVIAVKYGISKGQASNIGRRLSWRWLPETSLKTLSPKAE